MALLNIFGDLERFTTEVLYPYRYVITPLVIAAVVGALFIAYRLGAHLWVRRRPVVSMAIGIPALVACLYAGNYLLSPLWDRSFLEEESPLASLGADMMPATPTMTTSPTITTPPAATEILPTEMPATAVEETQPPIASQTATPAPEPERAAPFEPAVRYSGAFMGADDFHFGRGDAQIIETEPGTFVLRFENFSVRNGPDLFVYLSEDLTGESVDEALNLGGLKATDGAFNYEIPPGIDVSRVKSAVVWCRQFSVLFAHAALM